MLPTELRSFFSSLIPKLPHQAMVIVACSGGPDSVALARLLAQSGLPYRFCLGHVNHQLRSQESTQDVQFVKALARELRWPCETAVRSLKKLTAGNLEARARVERYNALLKMAQKKKSSLILTAHTRDDQTETWFLNFLRGAGPDGLVGMQAVRSLLPSSSVRLGRPLLKVSKEELRVFLRQHKFPFRTDSSNQDQGFLRNWLRHKVIPLIKKRVPTLSDRVDDAAQIFREEQVFWDGLVASFLEEKTRRFRGGRLIDFKDLLRYPAAVQRRCLRGFWSEPLLSFDALERLRLWMSAPPTSGRLWPLRKGWVVERLSKSKGAPSATMFWVHRVVNVTFENKLRGKLHEKV